MTLLQIRINDNLKTLAKHMAKELNISLSDVVRLSLQEFILCRKDSLKNENKKKIQLLKKLTKGNRDNAFMKLDNKDIDKLIYNY